MSHTTELELDPAERFLAAADRQRITLWAVDGSWKREFVPSDGSEARCFELSSDGESLLVGSEGGRIDAWLTADPDSARQIGEHGGEVADLAWSPDGQTIISVGALDRRVLRWSRDESGDWSSSLLFEDQVSIVEWSDDGRYLAFDLGAAIYVVDLERASKSRMLSGHSNLLSDFEFRPDGSSIAAATYGGLIHIWDLDVEVEEQTDEVQVPSLTLDGDTNFIGDISFSPYGRYLASAEGDETVLWDMDLEKVIAKACKIAGRELSEGEQINLLERRPRTHTCRPTSPS